MVAAQGLLGYNDVPVFRERRFVNAYIDRLIATAQEAYIP